VSKLMKSQKRYLFKNTVLKEGDKPAKTTFSGLADVEVGPAPEFEGSPETLNPEEMFVAAINNCLMTTFFYFVRKSNVEVLSYFSRRKGSLKSRKTGLDLLTWMFEQKLHWPNSIWLRKFARSEIWLKNTVLFHVR